MSCSSTLTRAGLFFAVGPLRTGSSLMARCIDDHPAAICLCESEINRALFKDYFLELHCERMVSHGLTLQEAIRFVDRKKRTISRPGSSGIPKLPRGCLSCMTNPISLPSVRRARISLRAPNSSRIWPLTSLLIYTVRDPRAILRSIVIQDDASPQLKAKRWEALVQNYAAWKPFLNDPNLLIVRYEDLITKSD